MLVLSRKCGEAILIGGGIAIKVVEIRGNRVKLAFDCPRNVRIMREEIFDALHESSLEMIDEPGELVAT